MISKRDINTLAEGKTPISLAGRPFIIMRQSITVPGTTASGRQWELATSPDECDSTAISREDAVRIIRANGMYVAMANRHGRIYEMPGQPFLERYNRRVRSAAS